VSYLAFDYIFSVVNKALGTSVSVAEYALKLVTPAADVVRVVANGKLAIV
jgi:hypothetical protein